MENIEDYLNYNVEDPEWLEVINGKLSLSQMINSNSLMRYIEIQNEKYCLQNNLCANCRTPLIEHKHYEEVHGSRQLIEITLDCPKCG